MALQLLKDMSLEKEKFAFAAPEIENQQLSDVRRCFVQLLLTYFLLPPSRRPCPPPPTHHYSTASIHDRIILLADALHRTCCDVCHKVWNWNSVVGAEGGNFGMNVHFFSQ